MAEQRAASGHAGSERTRPECEQRGEPWYENCNFVCDRETRILSGCNKIRSLSDYESELLRTRFATDAR